MYKVIKEFPGGPKVGTELDIYTTRDNRCFDPQYFPEYFKKVYDISKHTYKPISDNLELRQSAIHGLGIHTRCALGAYTYVRTSSGGRPITHYRLPGLDLIRTPTGGFLNHSENPNCVLHWTKRSQGPECATLFTIRHILAGEELTLNYADHYCGE